MENEMRWISTKDFLPEIGEEVLVLTVWGHITDAIFTDCGLKIEPTFLPGDLKPDVDVKWWMTIPTDGWNNLKEKQPEEGQSALTMGESGSIFGGVWRRKIYSDEFEFRPSIMKVLFWREIPELPKESVQVQKNEEANNG